MQYIKNLSLISIIGLIIIFLCTSFVKWNINPSTWSEGLRVMFIIFSVGWIFMAIIIAAAIDDLKNK